MRQLAIYLILSLMLGCASTKTPIKGKPIIEDGGYPVASAMLPPPPPPKVVESPFACSNTACKVYYDGKEPVRELSGSGSVVTPKVVTKVVYVDRVVAAKEAPPPPPVATTFTCPDCKPVITVEAPKPQKEGPWGFIASAFGGAASVIAAAVAKKYLKVTTSEG